MSWCLLLKGQLHSDHVSRLDEPHGGWRPNTDYIGKPVGTLGQTYRGAVRNISNYKGASTGKKNKEGKKNPDL